MIRTYLVLAWRNLVRNKGYAFINISGLAVGLMALVVILLYVNHETGYDQWDAQLDRVYRMGAEEVRNGEREKFGGWSPYPLGTQLAATCPEVARVTRITTMPEQIIGVKSNRFYEKKIISADSTFFDVFPYSFVYGSAATALKQPRSIVLSTEASRKLFGDSDPVGKTLDFVYADTALAYTVSGVFERKGPSHIDFDFCVSYFNKDPGNWARTIFTTYFLLNEHASPAQFSQKADRQYALAYYLRWESMSAGGKPVAIPSAKELARWMKEEKVSSAHLFFEPVSQIHIKPQAVNWRGAFSPTPVNDYAMGNHLPVMIFSVAGILILILACINYTNLAIAQAGKRGKETGVRKVLGSGRFHLVWQFLAEAFMQCLVALVIAVFFARIALVFFNRSFNLHLVIWNPVNAAQNWMMVAQLAAIIVITTLLSGTYPALFLSRYRPVTVLRGDTLKGVKGRPLRNGLIVAQFVISIAFISGMIIIYRQVSYMKNSDPGFDAAQVVSLKVRNSNLVTSGRPGERIQYLKTSLLNIPGVQQVAIADVYPGEETFNFQEAGFEGDTTHLSFNAIDFNYFKMFNMKLVEGRDFNPQLASDSINAAVLNESAVSKMKLRHPVGKVVRILARDYRIIGILKDNLNDGYQVKIKPNIYAIGAEKGMLGYDRILVKVNGRKAAASIGAITRFWQTVEPAFPLRYDWVDESFRKLMQKHEKLGKLSMAFTMVSLLIAMMGIFALTAFTAEQRKKEIGIRKVFGASVSAIVALLSRDFLKLVIIAMFIAFPVAWWIMDAWLQDFAYRIAVSWWMFGLAGSVSLVIAFGTVSFQALKAGMVKPVESLRNE
ncbi:ABC transporter permease [Hufsiella ginkgonis]|uniref:FtsX-like permease family protein n=1 Tax=Hufsiella ginkgonis TaxID=2695274 RepID=A0A7K1XSJ4_9SPHI|nr:ABC transporter permease [Hufsiella ginkgonis]MXV13983.1 FtsX-like permease family protein [Hufsiella ginkgonis]